MHRENPTASRPMTIFSVFLSYVLAWTATVAAGGDGDGDGKSNVIRRLHDSGHHDPYLVHQDPTTAPVECDPYGGMIAWLYNADTDMPIGPLGDTIDLCLYGAIELSIVGTPECKRRLALKLYDSEMNFLSGKIEGNPPFSLGDDFGNDVVPVPYLKMVGSYTLELDPYPGDMAMFMFDVTEC